MCTVQQAHAGSEGARLSRSEQISLNLHPVFGNPWFRIPTVSATVTYQVSKSNCQGQSQSTPQNLWTLAIEASVDHHSLRETILDHLTYLQYQHSSLLGLPSHSSFNRSTSVHATKCGAYGGWMDVLVGCPTVQHLLPVDSARLARLWGWIQIIIIIIIR